MKSFASEVFGNLSAPECFEEILSIILSPPVKSFYNVWMWRGQSDLSWPIHSAAYRRLQNGRQRPTDDDLLRYEKRLLKSATHRGFRRFGGAELSDFDLLARLQHHGAATRLLDTTRNALVGLYFACDQNPEKWSGLFGFHSDHLGGGEGAPLSEAYEDVINHATKHSHPQTWEPPNISPRIAAQHAQFLYSGVSSATYGSISVSCEKNALLAIALDPELKEKCLRILSSCFDIHGLTLFPDLGSGPIKVLA